MPWPWGRAPSISSGAGQLGFGTLTAATLGGLQGPGSVNLLNASGTAVVLSVGNNGASTTYSGSLSGSGSLAKIGGGTLFLTGSSTYSGGTILGGGVLNIYGDAALAPPRERSSSPATPRYRPAPLSSP